MKQAIKRNVGKEVSFKIGVGGMYSRMMGKIIRLGEGDDADMVRIRYRRFDGTTRYEWWPDAMLVDVQPLTDWMRKRILEEERKNRR